MGKIIILNGSPRAPKSNSKRYAEIFVRHSRSATQYAHITKNNHRELASKMSDFTDVLFVVPLYADALPVGFLNFLKTLEENPPRHKTRRVAAHQLRFSRIPAERHRREDASILLSAERLPHGLGVATGKRRGYPCYPVQVCSHKSHRETRPLH